VRKLCLSVIIRLPLVAHLSLVLFLGLSACSSPAPEVEKSETSNSFTLKQVDDVSGIKSSDVFSFVCELVTKRPKISTPYCADFGVSVSEIKWSNWSSSGAEGRGIYRENDCDPNCAEGNIFEGPVLVRLEGLYTDGERYFLRDFTYQATRPFPSDISSSGGWDVADFYLEVPEMRAP